jgi:hypothetical protein
MSTQKHDGGPAYPTTPVSHGYPANFDGHGTGCTPGMTLRDYFAAKALQAFLIRGQTNHAGMYPRSELELSSAGNDDFARETSS